MEHLSVAIADDNQRILDMLDDIIQHGQGTGSRRKSEKWRRDVSDHKGQDSRMLSCLI